MGYSNWSTDAFDHLRTERKTKTREQIFSSTSIKKDMNPKGVAFREARDSEAHPNSVPVFFAFDVTGSMDEIPVQFAKNLLGKLMDKIIQSGTPDPQILFGAIGDHISDQSPFQIGQFESGHVELDKWLTTIFLEKEGGPWGEESYSLAWLFAARHTKLDSFEKRGQKGYLITAGDERVHDTIDAANMKRIFGGQGEDLTAKELLVEAQQLYHVYHIHIEHSNGARSESVIRPWRELLGQNLIVLDDYNKIADTVTSIIKANKNLLTQ